MTKSAKIRRLVTKGKSPNEIAKALKVNPNYVHTIMWLDRKKKKKPSKIVKAVKQMDRELKRIKPDKKAEAWKKNNEWFGVDEKKTAHVLGLHAELIDQGVDPRSDEYYKRVDKEIKLLDAVNHPPHYRTGGIETIDFIEAKDLNYRLGNVVKYVSRAGRKLDSNPVEDLEKAAWYLNRELEARRGA